MPPALEPQTSIHKDEVLIAAEGHVWRTLEAQLRVFRSYSMKRRWSWGFEGVIIPEGMKDESESSWGRGRAATSV